jgi:hypothetical protein
MNHYYHPLHISVTTIEIHKNKPTIGTKTEAEISMESAIQVTPKMSIHDITVIMNDIFSPQLVPTPHHYGTHAQ